jgi:nicotinate-nucleotide adenylyltransferase
LRLGVLGGTFDPPHLGHLILAEHAREQLRLDRVRFVPAGEPWRKADRGITPGYQRLEMVRLAIADNPFFELDDCELRRTGPSYTAVTLREMRAALADEDELFFLVGEDALADLPFWYEPAAIAEAAVIVVAPREGAPRPLALPFGEDRIARITMPYVGISSTDLRRRAREGLSLRYLVPSAVETYIRVQGLYR